MALACHLSAGLCLLRELCGVRAKSLMCGGVQVHGDVFRAPTNSSLLAVYVGTGSQLLGMALVTMVFAVLGFLSPANRGGLMTAMLLLFAFMGIVGGYFSGRLYKRFKVRPMMWHAQCLSLISCFTQGCTGAMPSF